MATADDYASWIVKNADKKGTPDFDVVARAYADAMAGGAPKQSKAAADTEAWNAKVKGDLTGDMSGVGKFVAGYGKAVPDMVRGIGQRLGQGVDAMFSPQKNLSDLITGGAGKTMSSRLGLPQQFDIDEAKRLDAPLMATGAGTVGNVFGNIGAGVGAGAAIAATLPASIGAMGTAALTGGALGAAQPTATGDSTKVLGVNVGNAALANTLEGAGLGAGSVAAGQLIGAGYRGVKAVMEPFTAAGPQRIAGRTLQRFADKPSSIANLTNRPTATGAQPTLAEQTGDQGIAQLQDSLRAIDPQMANALAARAANNNAARVNTLQSLAGDSTQKAAAVATRDAVTKPLYQQAQNAAYTIDDKLSALLDRPAVQQAMSRAKTLAANQGRTVSFDVNPSNAFSSLGVPTNSTTKIKGQSLQDLKMAMDEMLTDPASGFTGKAGNTIRDLRGQLVSWMEEANPAFKNARESYATLSKPLNGMDTGAEIAKRAMSNTSDLAGNPRMQANALLGMLRDEPGLVQRATGRKELNALSDVFEPSQMNLLRTVAEETDRAAAVATAGNGPGSATAQRLASQNILRQTIAPNGSGGNSLAQKAGSAIVEHTLANTLAGKATNWLYSGIAEPKIQQALLKAVLSPEEAQTAIAAAQKQGLTLPNNLLTRLVGQARRVTGVSTTNSTRQP